VAEVAGGGEEFVGGLGVGDPADGFGAAFGQGVGVAELVEGPGEVVDGGVEGDDVAGGGFDPDGFGAVVVGGLDPDAALAGVVFGGLPGGVGVGFFDDGVDDFLQPVRREGVDDGDDAFVDQRRGLGGQFEAGAGDGPGAPYDGLAVEGFGPDPGKPVAQREGFADVGGGSAARDLQQHAEFGGGELGDRGAAVAAVHDQALTAAHGRRLRKGGVEVGEVQGRLEFAERGPVFFRVEFDGRVEGRGGVEVIPSIVEHAFEFTVTLRDRQITRSGLAGAEEPPARA
jgi:hypothetical protein